MKRSSINRACQDASACFARHHWSLPPHPKWDVTDFGLGDFDRCGLTLVTLTAEPEYCEKLMYARRRQTTPCHAHAKKKEDIICRVGELTLQLWPARPVPGARLAPSLRIAIDGEIRDVPTGGELVLPAGSRVTIPSGVWHAFWASSDECIIGEVSTANDDTRDNFFLDPHIGRFPGIEEDAPATFRLLSES